MSDAPRRFGARRSCAWGSAKAADRLSRGLAAIRDVTLFLSQGLLRRSSRNLRAADRRSKNLPSCRRFPHMTDRAFNVLFLCTGNNARSILAGIHSAQRWRGPLPRLLGGKPPQGEGGPFALKVLKAFDYPSDGSRFKSSDQYATPFVPKMDFVFTVCDDAAGEACPVWPGQPITARWGIEDPAAFRRLRPRKGNALSIRR